MEVASALASKRPLDMIPGSLVEERRSTHAQPRSPRGAVDALPTPAFDLTDFDAYETRQRRAKAGICHQRRLPLCLQLLHRHGLLQAALQCLSARTGRLRTTDLVTGIASKKWLCSIRTFPSNYPGASKLPAGSRDSGVKFRWTFQASTDFLCRMSEEEVHLLGRERRIAHGLRHRIHFGSRAEADEQAAPARRTRCTRPRARRTSPAFASRSISSSAIPVRPKRTAPSRFKP